MFIRKPITVRPVTERDRQLLANLIHFEINVHRHLDWRPPLDWVGYQPYLVAERRSKIEAVLICPPDPPEIAWIRMFAVSSELSTKEAWQALWPVAQAQIERQVWYPIAAIPLQSWFRTLLELSNFNQTYNIISLLWERDHPLVEPRNRSIILRAMTVDDLPLVHALDVAAFNPLWRNSISTLKNAFQQAIIATIAEDESGPLGYQISTANPMGGHLARLAVHPQVQGKGIGYALIYDLLNRFKQQDALRVTVNTQQDNLSSLALYEKAGFYLTGEVYPVYQYHPYRGQDRNLEK
jgi:ribosomal-protein-alanine N-acetyltransferase